jgi:hypothetical protein
MKSLKNIKLQTPEEVEKELKQKELSKRMGLTERDIQYVEDPLFAAQTNFEIFKSIFKYLKIFGGGKDPNKFHIERIRESVGGSVSKSLDRMRVIKNASSLFYMDLANRAFGVKTRSDDTHVYFEYDIVNIEKARLENNERK